jgi:hypothetical protein
MSKRLFAEGLSIPVEFTEAFDLRFIDRNLLNHWLEKEGLKIYKDWKTSNSEKFEGYDFEKWDSEDVSNPEVGCFLSHYYIWKKAKETGHTFLILYDDDLWNNG